MIRLTALWLAVAFVGAYTWKDWFKGLCGLILLVGILEYPDVPKTMFGIAGLNFFNLLLINVVLSWVASRQREHLKWDMPAHVSFLLVVYLVIIVVGWVRMFRSHPYMVESSAGLVSEYLFNTIKWAVPGLLLFDGCRSRERLRMAVFSFLGALVFLALMTIKVMPIGSVLLSGNDLQRLALKLLVNRIGYHRVTLSMMLGGAAWALVAARPMLEDKRLRAGLVVLSGVVLYAQSLTGGRAGYLTWGAIGFTFGVLRWRRLLLVIPVVALAVMLFMPGVVDRMLDGFVSSGDTITIDQYEASAGRTLIWPYVTQQIKRSLYVGYGRQAMARNGIATFLADFLGEDFGHPHNAYLEWLLDNGLVGFIPVMAFYLVILLHSFRLFLDSRSPYLVAAGGVSCAMVLALLVASMTSQSFYPVEGTFEMWCGMGVMLRLSVERKRALATVNAPVFSGGRFATAIARPTATGTFEDLILPERDLTPPSPRGFREPAPGPAPVAPSFAPRFAAEAPVARPESWKHRHPPAAASPSPGRFQF